MKVLVTGTDGYIGAMLAPLLTARGHEVVGLDTGFYRDGWLYGDPASLTQIRKDVRAITEDDLRGFDGVIHLAELSNDALGQHDPELTRQINHRGSVALAQKARAAGVPRFVYSSSCSVYGVSSDNFVTEESPTNPQTTYAECKVLAERGIASLADAAFAPTFLRNATAFGASPRMRFDIVLNNLAGLAWTTGEIAMTSDGTPWRPIVHVLDIGEAMACALEAPTEAVRGQIFNVGDSAQNYRVREIAEIVGTVFSDCTVIFGKNDSDNRSYRVAFDKIRQHLPAFRCRRDAAFGAREIHDIFARINFSADDFRFRAYTRLKQLDYLLDTEQVAADLTWNLA